MFKFTVITKISFRFIIDFQFHQFHFLQVVDYLAFADETAVSPQFHIPSRYENNITISRIIKTSGSQRNKA